MTPEHLGEALGLLLREHQHKAGPLNAAARRTIRTRVATRWVGGIGGVVAIVGLGVTAIHGAYTRGEREYVIASPAPSVTTTPTIRFAAATFPLTGGPEFVPASSALECGDPAPAPHPEDHDLHLTINLANVSGFGDPVIVPGPPVVQAVVRGVTTSDLGTVATSGVDFLVIKDGVITGIIPGDGVDLSQNVAIGNVTGPQGRLLADTVRCRGNDAGDQVGVEPGTYEVIAIGRVFSTPESVALAQAIGGTINAFYLNPNASVEPDDLYLPGSYACEKPRPWAAALRGCLPTITGDAVVDETAGTVTVNYHTTSLVEEFSSVLVSEPLTVELVLTQDVEPLVTFDFPSMYVEPTTEDAVASTGSNATVAP